LKTGLAGLPAIFRTPTGRGIGLELRGDYEHMRRMVKAEIRRM
jgi:hypothetical protein